MMASTANPCLHLWIGHWLSKLSIVFYFLKLSADFVCAELQELAINVALKKSCDHWALFEWKPEKNVLSETSHCQLNTLALNSDSDSKTESIYPRENQEILISKLKKNTAYTFYMLCDEVYISNNVSFVTGSSCENSEDDSTPFSVKEPGTKEEGPVSDIILGTICGLIGLIIICVFLYQIWKNYVRRQRINRIFREVETDPFTSLQNHMEEQNAANL